MGNHNYSVEGTGSVIRENKANLKLPNPKVREERENAGNLFGFSVAENTLTAQTA